MKLRQLLARYRMAMLGFSPAPITRDELFANYECYELRKRIAKIEAQFSPVKMDLPILAMAIQIKEARR